MTENRFHQGNAQSILAPILARAKAEATWTCVRGRNQSKAVDGRILLVVYIAMSWVTRIHVLFGNERTLYSQAIYLLELLLPLPAAKCSKSHVH